MGVFGRVDLDTPGRGNPLDEKIFISANIVDASLVNGRWGKFLVELVDLLGEDNVFISIYENDSGAETSSALRSLSYKLSCNSSIVSGAHLSVDKVARFSLHHRLIHSDERNSRIDYLASVRNELLKPLDSTYTSNGSTGVMSAAKTSFNRILFLNDVFFDPIEAVQLLFLTNTQNGRAEYRAACALDFVRGAQVYDTFVLRDDEGYSSGLMVYPWFAPVGRSTSRNAVLEQRDAVPVWSCWGGMAAFDAVPFQTRDASSVFSNERDYDLPRFRSTKEASWEASECCLIFADLEDKFGSPNITGGTGVFVNPYIRTAYSETTREWLPHLRRIESVFQYVQYMVSYILYPSHKPRRLHEPGDFVVEDVWQKVGGRGAFVPFTRHAAPGGFCGQRQMMVMKKHFSDHRGKSWQKLLPPI